LAEKVTPPLQIEKSFDGGGGTNFKCHRGQSFWG
jgi:hypothetical protein